jgi:hypothetical protein
MYTNQTGQFPVKSSQGNKLIMVLYEIDGNYTDAKTMQDSRESSLTKAYNTLWARVTKSGKVRPTVHILDNKALKLFKEKFEKIVTYSWSHQVHIIEISLNTPFRHLRVISLPFWQD